MQTPDVMRAALAALAFAITAACVTPRDGVSDGPVERVGSENPELTVFAWNTNSGLPWDASTHAGQIRFVREAIAASGADIVALSEVAPDWFDEIENRADEERPTGLVRSTSGCNQRLAVLFDEQRLDVLSRDEMTGVPETTNGCRRAPLVVGFRDRVTGAEFDLVALHLYRGEGADGDRDRAGEAMRLRQLLEARGSRPVVVIGDANVDCPVDSAPQGCNAAFEELVAGDFLRWVDFVERASTSCSGRYDSMLDIALVGRGVESWAPRAVVHRDDVYCDEMASGAHRPIGLSITPPATTD